MFAQQNEVVDFIEIIEALVVRGVLLNVREGVPDIVFEIDLQVVFFFLLYQHKVDLSYFGVLFQTRLSAASSLIRMLLVG